MKSWDEMVEAAAKAFNGEVRVMIGGGKVFPPQYRQAAYELDVPDMDNALRAALADAPLFVVDLTVGAYRVLGRASIQLPRGRYLLLPIPPEQS
jgi:hypothetical protein